MRRAGGWEQNWFEVESFRVDHRRRRPVHRTGRRHHRGHHQGARRRGARDRHRRGQRSGERARHRAARRARRPLPGARARCTSPTTRCACSTPPRAPAPSPGCWSTRTNGERTWTTIGVSENIIEASWQALYDSLVYGLLLSRRRASSTPPVPTDPFVAPELDDLPRQETEPRARACTCRAAQGLAGRPPRRSRRRAAHRDPARPARARTSGTR